jgi:cell wall-associated NlpC family hydrolase
VQTIFRFYDVLLPRDAKDQYLEGQNVDINNIKESDLAFFENEQGKITHVGILDGKNKIIHASGWVRWDQFDEKGITNTETGLLTHKLSGIKRFISEK